MSEETLADAVHRWTFRPRVFGRPVPKLAERVTARYRSLLRRAERYVLDDEATELVCELSTDREKMDTRSVLARLPFDVVWVELNLHAKVRKFYELGTTRRPLNPDDVSPTVGYLIYRDEPEGQRWVAHEFVLFEDNVVPAPVALVFDPDGRSERPTRGAVSLRLKTLADAHPDLKVPATTPGPDLTPRAFVSPEAVYAGDLRVGDQDIIGAPWTVNRSAAVVEPLWSLVLADDPRSLAEALRRDPIERAGLLRYLVVLLGAMNGLPLDVREKRTSSGTRTVGPNLLPYLQLRRLNLRLPRDNRVAWARRTLDRAARNARRPWHRVAGHWRVIERGRSTRSCFHHPVMVEDDLALCDRCQLLVRWVADHSRGDPTIGIVEHVRRISA